MAVTLPPDHPASERGPLPSERAPETIPPETIRRRPAGTPARAAPPSRLEPLWRHALGDRLRRLRQDRGEKLTETAARAGLSPQYLSEIERGVKEPSSEMIAAVAGALDTTLLDLTSSIAHDLRAHSAGTRPRTQGTAYALTA